MTTISDGAFSQGDVMRRLADLERMVANLSTSRRLEAASIGQGGVSITNGAVKIYDADGLVRAQIGKLPDGSYDIAAFDQLGASVDLAAMAFGLVVDKVDAAEGTPSSGFVDLTTFGPTVSTNIGNSGRALVYVGASIGGDVTGFATMSFDVADGDGNLISGASLEHGLGFSNGAKGKATAVIYLTGLPVGFTVFSAKYTHGGPTNGSDAIFTWRTLAVQPF